MTTRMTFRVGLQSSRMAFTLIEMLLVVAIIALLVALLLPSLNMARDASRTVACAASQRQLTQAYISYVRDNAYRSFAYAGNHGQEAFDNFWMSLLENYSGKVDDLRICPQASIKADRGAGSATLAWSGHTSTGSTWLASGGDHHYGSFGLNGWLYRGWSTSWIRLNSKTLEPNLTPILGDAMWVDGWPTTFDTPAADLQDPYSNYFAGGPVPPQLARWAMNRHGQAINISTYDGATQLTPLKNLWSLRWSTTFVPDAFSIPGL